MKFMITWDIAEDKWLPILKMWSSMTPQQRADGGPGVQDPRPLARHGGPQGRSNSRSDRPRRGYAGQWNPHMGLAIAPVMDDEELAVVGKQIVEANGVQ